MSHCLPSPPPKPAAPTFQIAASSKQTQLITGPSLADGSPCFSRGVVSESIHRALIFQHCLQDLHTFRGHLSNCAASVVAAGLGRLQSLLPFTDLEHTTRGFGYRPLEGRGSEIG